MSFGQWIKRTRGTTSAAACARLAGMSPSEWSRWESETSRRADGKPSEPSQQTIAKIAVGLGVSVDLVRAAAYPAQEELPMRLARELEPILMQAPPSRRPAIEAALQEVAKAMVGSYI